jgi:hypothetical protein
MITGGSDVDALIAGVLRRLDPLDDSVNCGDLPNAGRRAARFLLYAWRRNGRAASRRSRACAPRPVAQMMDLLTTTCSLGTAQDFAQNMGWIGDLNAENSRRLSGSAGPIRSLRRRRMAAGLSQVAMDMIAEGLVDRDHYCGTIAATSAPRVSAA